MIERLLSETLEQRFQKEDLQDCFLVDIVTGTGKKERVEVYVDCDSFLSLEKCRKISRFLEHEIEDNGWLGERYTLEVSSPGLDRPLKLYRQYVKNVGRNIRVDQEDSPSIEGKLKEVSSEEITITIPKKGVVSVKMANIIKAKILVSFK